MKLKDRVAIVTGASSGIGRGICMRFAQEGARVVVADIQEQPKQGIYHEQSTTLPTVEAIRKIGGEAHFVHTDVAAEGAVKELVDVAVDTYGGIDIIVNNAGIYGKADSQQLRVAEWDRVMGINLRGVFLLTKFSIPQLSRSPGGRIINIASVHAFAGGAGPAYTAAKAAVVNLTRDTAVEVADRSITVNAVCPGYIETALQDYQSPEQIEAARVATPLPRLGRPEDVGHACTFFASDEAAWITGAALAVDGGYLARI
jgi:NAD(P)-dependent dehydrogenase (short-subunit alcohol dehydrogenase family)